MVLLSCCKGVDLAGGRAVGGVGEQPELGGDQPVGADGFRVAVEEGVQDRGARVFEVGEGRGVVAAAQRRFDVVRDGRQRGGGRVGRKNSAPSVSRSIGLVTGFEVTVDRSLNTVLRPWEISGRSASYCC